MLTHLELIVAYIDGRLFKQNIMKPKYIDEKYRHYFIFGINENGIVDINNGIEDICSVTKEEAKKLIEDRDSVLKLLHLINEKYPNEFNECFNAT